MAYRSKEQIVDQLVYAVACAAQHYGPGLSDIGLQSVRQFFDKNDWWVDASYRCDVSDSDQYADFDKRITNPGGWHIPNFEETIANSKSCHLDHF